MNPLIRLAMSGIVIGLASAEPKAPLLPKVVGVVYAEANSATNQVILEDPTNNEQDVFSAGSKAFQRFLVKQVTKEFVVIVAGNETFRIPMSGGSAERLIGTSSAPSVERDKAAPHPAPHEDLKIVYMPGGKTPQQIREFVQKKLKSNGDTNIIVSNNYESFLRSDFIQQVMQSPEDMVGPSRAFAPTQNLEGVSLGLRIVDIDAAGMLSAFGFHNGDILVAVNVHPVHSYETLRSALQDPSQGRVLIDYIRDNRQSSYAINAY